MKSLSKKSYLNKLRPFLLVAGGFFFYTVVLGLRGTSAAGVELIGRMRALNTALINDQLSEKGADLLASPHVFVDVLGIPLATIFDNEVMGFGLISALAVSLALPAIWRMTAAVSGGVGAALATGLFLGMPIVAGAATAAGPAAIVLVMWCWLLRLSTLSRYTWWTTLVLVLLAAALVLSWAPVLVWLPAWLVATIAAQGLRNHASRNHASRNHASRNHASRNHALQNQHLHKQTADTDARGMIGPTSVPLALVLATVGIVFLPSIFFVALGFEPSSLPGAWEIFLNNSLVADWSPVLFGGEVFATQRPPLTTGLVWTAFEFPPEVVVGAVAALLLPATRRLGIFAAAPPRAQNFEFPRALSMLTLIFLLGLPWALRTRDVGGVPTLLLASPILAILAGNVFATLVRVALTALERRDIVLRTRRAVLVGLLGLFLLPGLITTVLIHPFEESYYNLFAGSIAGAMRAGHPATRGNVLPIDIAQSVAGYAGTQTFYAGPWLPQFQAYVREGYLEPLNSSDDPATAETSFHERKPDSARLENEPAKRVTWGPEGVGVFVLDIGK
jgi:hypothetical protein